jgi:5-methylcytosine-specific restriction endonuclease McrA
MNKSPRRKLSPKKYRALCEYVYNRDGFCVFCGRPDMLTPAHIVRRSQGGHDAANNIVAACVLCHQDFDACRLALPEKVKKMLEGEP